MTVSNNGPSLFDLPPPDPRFAALTNEAVSVKTGRAVGVDTPATRIQEATSTFVDQISSAGSIIKGLFGSPKVGRISVQSSVDNIDPGNPVPPIIGRYTAAADKAFREGKVTDNTLQFTSAFEDVGEEDDSSIAAARAKKKASVQDSKDQDQEISDKREGDVKTSSDKQVKIKQSQTEEGEISGLDQDTEVSAATAELLASSTQLARASTKNNPWLAGNAYIAFMENFMTLAKLMMESSMVQSKCEVQGLGMLFEMGKLTADQIITAGEKARDMHRVAGFTAAATAAVIGVTTLVSVGGMVKNMKKMEATPEGDFAPVSDAKLSKMSAKEKLELTPDTNPKSAPVDGQGVSRPNMTKQADGTYTYNYDGSKVPMGKTKEAIKLKNERLQESIRNYRTFTDAASQFGQQTSTAVKEFLTANLEMEKSQAEARKEIFSTLNRLIGHSLDKATEGVKSNHELLNQLIQQLDSIRAKLHEGISASLKKGG